VVRWKFWKSKSPAVVRWLSVTVGVLSVGVMTLFRLFLRIYSLFFCSWIYERARHILGLSGIEPLLHMLANSEHKLCQTWNTCIVSCIYWSIAFLSKLLVFFFNKAYYQESTILIIAYNSVVKIVEWTLKYLNINDSSLKYLNINENRKHECQYNFVVLVLLIVVLFGFLNIKSVKIWNKNTTADGNVLFCIFYIMCNIIFYMV
jgi:hypothetical protein